MHRHNCTDNETAKKYTLDKKKIIICDGFETVLAFFFLGMKSCRAVVLKLGSVGPQAAATGLARDEHA